MQKLCAPWENIGKSGPKCAEKGIGGYRWHWFKSFPARYSVLGYQKSQGCHVLLCGHPWGIGNRGNLKCENYSHVVMMQKIFTTCALDLHTPSAANMDTGSLLVSSVQKVMDDVVKGSIVDGENISAEKLRKHRYDLVLGIYYFTFHLTTILRIRAQGLVTSTSSTIDIGEKEGEMASIIDVEVEHCAAVIAAAFLNPCKQYSNSNSNSFCSINSQTRLIWIMIGLANRLKSGKNRENIITKFTWVLLRGQPHLSICTEK